MAVTITRENGFPIRKFKFVVTSIADGSASGATTERVNGEVVRFVAVPDGGATTPTDQFDIAINDADGDAGTRGYGDEHGRRRSRDLGSKQMPPREVNVYTSNWRATGANVSVPQYELTVRFQWVDNDGVSHEGERTVRFPNVLSQMPATYVGERMKEMLLDYARQTLGVDA